MNAPAYPTAARVVRAWSRVYTWRLPTDIAWQRRAEIAADVHDHLVDRTDLTPAALARAITVRMILGVPADLSWRSEQVRANRLRPRRSTAMSTSSRSHRALALALGLVVVGWGVTMSIGAAFDHQTNRTLWAFFTTSTAAGVVGLVLLARRQFTAGLAVLAFAALATTIPFFWMPPIWIAGSALAVYFLSGLRRSSDHLPAPLTPPLA